MEIGFFYIATTPQYIQRNIYKIGTTKNLDLELEQINYNRLPDEEFYIIIFWNTFSSKIIEYNMLERLKIYKIKNKLFLCNLEILKNIYNDFIYSQSFMTFFYDYLYLFGIYYNIQWSKQDDMFMVNNVECSEINIIENIKKIFIHFNMDFLLYYINAKDYQIYLQFLKDNFDK